MENFNKLTEISQDQGSMNLPTEGGTSLTFSHFCPFTISECPHSKGKTSTQALLAFLSLLQNEEMDVSSIWFQLVNAPKEVMIDIASVAISLPRRLAAPPPRRPAAPLPRCLCSRATWRMRGSSIRVRNKWTKRAETGNVGDKLGQDPINAA